MTQKATARRIKNREKVQQALDLRRDGASYAQIAATMKCSRTLAYRRVQSGLQELNATCANAAEELRRMELERCDYLTLKLWPQSSNPRVTDSLLRIMERRAKLLGLDAPQKIAETDAQGNNAPRQARAILHAKLLG